MIRYGAGFVSDFSSTKFCFTICTGKATDSLMRSLPSEAYLDFFVSWLYDGDHAVYHIDSLRLAGTEHI